MQRSVVEFVGKTCLLMRTAEILGQILKNYYGSLERPVKATLLRQVFDGPLRVVRALLGKVMCDPESFVKWLESALEEQWSGLSSQEKRKAAKKSQLRSVRHVVHGHGYPDCTVRQYRQAE